MPIVRPIGGQPGSLAPLLLLMLLWTNGCQSLAPQSEGTIGSDSGWTITGQAGLVSLRSPHQSFWHRARPGARIAPGSQVVTFDGSRLELASAGDELTASGPSRFTLPKAERNGVRVRQDAGSLRYEVQSAPKRHFEVKTPHFSTVVKGTTFLISIDRTSSEVFVDEGRVLILDVNGEPLAELTAGQSGRMAAQPGATLEVSMASDPSLRRTEPGAGLDPSAHGNTAFPETTGVTRASLGAPISEAAPPAADLSLLERIGSVLGDLAVQIRPGDGALTGDGVHLTNDRNGGGAREQESRSQAGSQIDGSPANENGDAKGKGGRDNGKGRDNSKGKGHGKGKGNGKGKGHDKDHGHGHGNGRGNGAGDEGAYLFLDRDDRGHAIAWNERP